MFFPSVLRSLPSLLGVGLVMLISPCFVQAADGSEPGTIVPRVPRRVAVQDANPEEPVPNAALQAPGEQGELNATPAPAGVRIAPRISRDEYRMAYHTVPFNLAESQANPGYRHAAAMKFLTGEYPPAPAANAPAAPGGPIFDGFEGVGGFGGAFFGNSPARGFPGLIVPGGWSGPPTFGPPPFAFDRFQGVVPTFVNRYQTPSVFLPRR